MTTCWRSRLRTKRLPPAPEPGPTARETVEAARDAVGRVPDSEADCCARVSEAVDVDRRAARDWLTLLRALGLVERSAGEYRRTEDDVDGSILRRRVLTAVYGAREVFDALPGPDGEARSAAAVVDAVRQPTWEHHRHVDPGAAWARHVERLLDWLAAVGAVEQGSEGYRRAAAAGVEGGGVE